MAVRTRDVITRDIQPFEIAKAVGASFWKSSFVRDTFIRNRTQFEKYQRSVIGDMAKLSIKSWFREVGFEATDWDDIRNSWRSQRKTYDLLVNNHNIEIRSSISKYDAIAQVLRNESIIHPCNVNVKEITVQAFFSDERCAVLWICGWALGSNLGDPSLRGPIWRSRRPSYFYRMPFNHSHAQTMTALLRYLR
ncbi:MAG: hypothetical protein WBB67_11830 [bacterium]